MKQEEVKKHVGKKVKIILTNNYRYSGIVLKVDEECLLLKDKFSNNVSIDLSSIMLFEEVNDG